MQFIILIIFTLLSFLISAICGGGAGLILMPIIGLFLLISYVPAALSMGTFSSSASRIFVFYSKIRWNIVKWFVPAAVPAVFLGVWLLSLINLMYIQLILGLFLLGNLPELLSGQKKKNQIHKLCLIPFWH